MLCREYGVLPLEPSIEMATKNISITIPPLTGEMIDENFLQLYSSSYNNFLKYVDQPIKGPASVSEASIVSYVLDSVDNMEIFKKNLYNTKKPIEIVGAPSFIKDYSSYKALILNLVSVLPNRIILNNEKYLADILNDIQTYNGKIQALGTSVHGICASQDAKVESLLFYNVNKEVLKQHINLLKNNNIDLILDLDSICAPTESITNTFASQIWLFDTLCQISSLGVKNVFVNMDSFSNIYGVLAYLYFSRKNAVINQINIIDSNINIYVAENVGEYLVAVVHKDDSLDSVSVTVNNANNGSLIRLITNQTYQGTCGMTFGNLTFDGSTNGLPIQVQTRNTDTRFNKSNVNLVDNSATFVVSRMSIAILKISKSMSGGAYFETINNSDEKRTVITIRPDQLTNEYDSVPTTMTVKEFKKNYQPYM